MTATMPVLFVGHGSPMNTIDNDHYKKSLSKVANQLPRPDNILVISAHWQTQDLEIYSEAQSRMIYDFYGFPEKLYQIQYPAPGSIELTEKLQTIFHKHHPIHNINRGLDHGAWAVLRHLYPDHKIPVVQLSLKNDLSFQEHYQLGKELAPLRSDKTLILASGNITHNLHQISWDKNPPAFDWAQQFDQQITEAIQNWNEEIFLGQAHISAELWKKAHPTIEHYLPLLYILGAGYKEKATFFNTEIQNGSMSMKSLLLGNI